MTIRRYLKYIFLNSFFCFISIGSAATLIVDDDGGTSDGYMFIQDAIDDATIGDVVLVMPGEYFENLIFNKNIILQSSDPTDWNVVKKTIINGSEVGSVIRIEGELPETSLICGFTITNGFAIQGGGIYGGYEYTSERIYNNTEIKNNLILNNEAIGSSSGSEAAGGGIFNCDGNIYNNIIVSNFANRTHLYTYCSLRVCGGYTLFPKGGGVSNCDGRVFNNVIFNNESEGVFTGFGEIYNNLILSNEEGITTINGEVYNNIIYNNQDFQFQKSLSSEVIPKFNCIEDWDGLGIGNFSDDPMIIGKDVFSFTLDPNSPCIDAGNSVSLTDDIYGKSRAKDGTDEIRGDGSDYDIGPFEFDPMPPLIRNYILNELNDQNYSSDFDLDNDGEITINDVVLQVNK